MQLSEICENFRSSDFTDSTLNENLVGENHHPDLLFSDTANTGQTVLISEFIKMINLNTASACTKYL